MHSFQYIIVQVLVFSKWRQLTPSIAWLESRISTFLTQSKRLSQQWSFLSHYKFDLYHHSFENSFGLKLLIQFFTNSVESQQVNWLFFRLNLIFYTNVYLSTNTHVIVIDIGISGFFWGVGSDFTPWNFLGGKVGGQGVK